MTPFEPSSIEECGLGYHAMRLRWGGLALLDFMRRWGVYVLIGSLVLSAGSNAPFDIVMAGATWLVLPLFRAASLGAEVLPMLLLQAMIGCALLWGMRPLLWPLRWAEAESALPLRPRDLLVSDALMVIIGLVPLLSMQALGASSLLAHDPAWLHPLRWRAVMALLVAALLTIAGGTALLQGQRRRLSRIRGRRVEHLEVAVRATLQRANWRQALLWWPLLRGPARRTAHASMLATAVLALPAVGLAMKPDLAPWCFAAFASLALLATTRIDSLARLEWAPLLDASIMLPIDPRQVRVARSALVLVPVLPGMVALLSTLPQRGVRPMVLAAYVFACFGVCTFEIFDHPPEASNRSSRWLFLLVVLLALSSEVMN